MACIFEGLFWLVHALATFCHPLVLPKAIPPFRPCGWLEGWLEGYFLMSRYVPCVSVCISGAKRCSRRSWQKVRTSTSSGRALGARSWRHRSAWPGQASGVRVVYVVCKPVTSSNCQYERKGTYGKIREVKSPQLLEWNDLSTNT